MMPPLELSPTPTQVGELADVQATWFRLVTSGSVVDDHVDEPPHAAVAVAVPFPVPGR